MHTTVSLQRSLKSLNQIQLDLDEIIGIESEDGNAYAIGEVLFANRKIDSIRASLEKALKYHIGGPPRLQ